jgi:hypothetical protein
MKEYQVLKARTKKYYIKKAIKKKKTQKNQP